MGLLDSIGRLIKKIISVVFKFIKKIFGKFFLLLLILVIIWFAPYLAGFFAGIGAPAFIVTAFETIALLTPYLVSAVTWLWEGGSSLVSSAWTAFKGAEVGTQASIVMGAAALIAPEETAAVIRDAVDLVADAAITVGGALLKSPWVIGLIGVAGYLLFFSGSKSDKERTPLYGDI